MLVDAGYHHTCQRSNGGGYEYGDKDVCGLFRTHLCPIDHYTNRYETQSTGIQNQKHNHGICGSIFLCIQLL